MNVALSRAFSESEGHHKRIRDHIFLGCLYLFLNFLHEHKTLKPFSIGLTCLACVAVASGLFSFVLVRGQMRARAFKKDSEVWQLQQENRELLGRVLELEDGGQVVA